MSIPRITKAMDYIGDDLVADAIEYKRTKNKNTWVKWVQLAACLVLVVALGIPLIRSITSFFEKKNNEGIIQQGASVVCSIDFNSFGELRDALNSQDTLYSYFSEHNVSDKQVESVQNMVESICFYNNIVPYIDNKVIELRNEEGFSNITLFSSEKYGWPSIMYHPSVSNDNLYITVTCIPDDFTRDNASLTASELIKKIAPSYPNIDNFGTYCSSVYNAELKLSDREVTAMVYEYISDARNSTIFIYDNLLVEIRNNPEIWGEDWFSDLSFGGF